MNYLYEIKFNELIFYNFHRMTDNRYPEYNEVTIHYIKNFETLSTLNSLNSERVVAPNPKGETQEPNINRMFKRRKNPRNII